MNGSKGIGPGLKAAAVALLVVVAGLLTLSQVSAQDPTVSIDRITIAFGEQGTVSLSSLDIDPPGLGAWEIGILYDPAVTTPVGCVELGGSVCNIGFSSNQIRVTGASASGHVGDEDLARITFACNSNDAITALTLIVDVFSDATIGNPQPIARDLDHGSVSCDESGDPAPTATRRPTSVPPPTAVPTDVPDGQPTAPPGATPPPGATTAPTVIGGATTLPDVGSGSSGGSSFIGWLIAGLTAAGLAGTAGFAALRLRANRTRDI